jgi:hypothetical protein
MALKQAVDPKGIIEIDPFGIKKNFGNGHC